MSRRLMAGGGTVVAALVVIALLLNGSPGSCGDIDRLLREAETDFDGIRGAPVSDQEHETSLSLDGAEECVIIDDVERSSYQCTWEHTAVSGDGPISYDAEVIRVRECLTDASESEDASVNHPDYWASTYFDLGSTEVSVGVKAKSALGLVLVTIGVDAVG